MSHGSNPPSLVINSGGNRQQVPLRDYLNARLAPFLKKAITESLGVEAEYPLQWLGECLIHQSILYEGNPDKTNIRDRFLYDFQNPVAAAIPEAVEEPASAPQVEAPAPTDDSMQDDITATTITSTAPTEPVPSADAAPAPTPAPVPIPALEPAPAPVPNGVDEEDHQATGESKDVDTEMGGTS